MTAIAAVLACSTPSFAQSADPPVAETPAPMVDVAPAPVVPAPVADTPIVPDTPVAADTLAPAEAVATPRRATTARTTPATRPSAARSRPAPARAASAAPAAAAAPAPATATAPPVAEAPVVEPLPIEPEAAPVVAPVEAADTSSDGMMIPLAAGALAIVALAGAALFLRRRKRHTAEADERAMREAELAAIEEAEPAITVEPEPQADPVQPAFVAAPPLATKAAPVIAAAPVADPTPEVDGPVTDLPEDFDLSRFGYNVQEAYKGPTEDNPSLSMKNRLTRARGMDQLERNLDAEVEAATGEPVLTEDELKPPAEEQDVEPATVPQAAGGFITSKPDQEPRPASPE